MIRSWCYAGYITTDELDPIDDEPEQPSDVLDDLNGMTDDEVEDLIAREIYCKE